MPALLPRPSGRGRFPSAAKTRLPPVGLAVRDEDRALPLLGLAAGIGIAAYATLTLDYQTRLIRAVVVGDLPVAMRLFEEAGSLQT